MDRGRIVLREKVIENAPLATLFEGAQEKPEVDGVLQHEHAQRNKNIPNHLLTGPFHFVLQVFFPRKWVGKFLSEPELIRKKEQRNSNRNAVFFEIVLPSLARRTSQGKWWPILRRDRLRRSNGDRLEHELSQTSQTAAMRRCHPPPLFFFIPLPPSQTVQVRETPSAKSSITGDPMANTSCPFMHWWWPCTCRKSPAEVKKFVVSPVAWELQFGLVRLRIHPWRCETWCQLDEVTREKLSNTWQGAPDFSTCTCTCRQVLRSAWGQTLTNWKCRRRRNVFEQNSCLSLTSCLGNPCVPPFMIIIGSAEALPILCVRYIQWERELQRERERKTEVTSPLSR